MTDKISSLPPVSEMMRASGLEPKKQFGQNFLFELNLTGRIARSVPNIEKSTVRRFDACIVDGGRRACNCN